MDICGTMASSRSPSPLAHRCRWRGERIAHAGKCAAVHTWRRYIFSFFPSPAPSVPWKCTLSSSRPPPTLQESPISPFTAFRPRRQRPGGGSVESFFARLLTLTLS